MSPEAPRRELPRLLVVVADLRSATPARATLKEAAVALVTTVVVVAQDLKGKSIPRLLVLCVHG